MAKLLDLTLYNPDQLDDEAFLAGFIARRQVVEKILSRLGGIKPRGLAQHRLIVGQRGMGKTSLLRRIALGVRDRPELAAVLLPLTFREEQYNVHNLHIFWCNCLDALGDRLEAEGRTGEAASLDAEVAALDARKDDAEGSQALDVFRRWMKREQRRPLLLLDNLDILFDGLKDKQWSLRRVLQESGGIVIIGASVAALEAAADREAAFYDFFQVDVLDRLPHHEILLCLRHMAYRREDGGRKVLEILDRDPARIHALYDLTGGNPRTLAMLYLVLETGGDDGVMRDLERLLDQATPLYKARVEELAPQARVVFDALALAWNPTTAAEIAEATGLNVGGVSTQLDRLSKDGVIEKVTLPSTSRTAFQVAERFFNIWYLMRHSPRRQRLRLRWLTEMLRQIYSPQELREWARGLLGRMAEAQAGGAEYCLALSDAIDDRELRRALRASVWQQPGRPIADEWSWTDEETHMQLPVMEPKHREAAIETYRKAIEHNPQDAGLWKGLGRLLEDVPDKNAEAETAYRKALDLEPDDRGAWFRLGCLLAFLLKQPANAETAFRKVLEIKSDDFSAWNNLGLLLASSLKQPAEAEAAFRRALEIKPDDFGAWNNLGFLFASSLKQPAEAEAAFRRALEIKPDDFGAWNNFGNLLASPLGRPTEAEAAYRKALEIEPRAAWIRTNLGGLLEDKLERPADAEAVYRKALEFEPGATWVWAKLGRLLANKLKRPAEAEVAYRKAIEIEPNSAWTWNILGNLLADQESRSEDAEQAYGKALELAPGEASSLVNLAYLRIRRGTGEVETIYRQAVAALPPHGAGLLRAFHALAANDFGTATAELGTVLEEGHAELFTNHRDDLLRVLQFAEERGYGDRLLDWLKGSALGDRYWPLQVAFEAYLHGEERLLEVNPEVRSGARRLLAEMRWKAPQQPPEPRKATRRKAVKRPAVKD